MGIVRTGRATRCCSRRIRPRQLRSYEMSVSFPRTQPTSIMTYAAVAARISLFLADINRARLDENKAVIPAITLKRAKVILHEIQHYHACNRQHRRYYCSNQGRDLCYPAIWIVVETGWVVWWMGKMASNELMERAYKVGSNANCQ